MKKHFYGHGKLLLTGEYAVLDGALALAFPTKKGQHLYVTSGPAGQLTWTSIDENGNTWFAAKFDRQLTIRETTASPMARKLANLLSVAQKLNPEFDPAGSEITTSLEFDRQWGLGSSSTLVYTVACWAGVDPLKLSETSFGGSGYDVACAGAQGPVFYQLSSNGPQVHPANINWPFTDKLFFVWLGKKQLSNREVSRYSDLQFDRPSLVRKISDITRNIALTDSFEEFQELLRQHEQALSHVLQMPRAGNTLFKGIDGVFKSLGAWGGDFVLFAGREQETEKIRQAGFQTIIPWREMLLG